MKAKTLLNLEGSGRVITDTSTSTSIANKTVVSDLISDYDVQVQKYLNEKIDNDTLADYVVDQGTSGIWTWRKWNSGISECWGIENTASSSQQVEGGMYYSVKYVDFPTNLFIATPCTTVSAHGNWIGGAMTGTALSKTTYQGYLYTPTSAAHTRELQTMIHARGRWK